MTAPTFKKATDTAVDPANVKYGAPDIKYIVDVLDGTHASDRVQATNIEGAVSATGTTDFTTGTKTFRDGILRIRNPANTFSYIVKSSAITTPDKNVTLPLLTADDTFVMKDMDQTLGIKRFPSGDLRVNNPAGTFAYHIAGSAIAANRTLTLPLTTALDTLVSENVAQTLTLKTISAANNTLPNIVTSPEYSPRQGGWWGGAGTSGVGFLGGALSQGAVAPTHHATADGKFAKFPTGTVANVAAGQRGNAASVVCRVLQPNFKWKFRLVDTTALRFYIGFEPADAFITGEDPFNATSGFAVGWRSGDTNMQVLSNDGSGATSVVQYSGAAITKDTAIHTVQIRAPAADTSFEVSVDGNAYHSLTTNIPGSTTVVHPVMMIEPTTTTAKSVDLFWLMAEISS